MHTLTRIEAGRRLAQAIGPSVTGPAVVVAVSPGGIRVASEVARLLDVPLDILSVVRLDVPGRPHSTFGAVAEGLNLVLESQVAKLGLPPDYVACLVRLARGEVERRTRAWRGGAPAVDLTGKTVVLVDDGSSDSTLVAAAATALRRRDPSAIVYAAPGASPALWRSLADCCAQRILLFPVANGLPSVRDDDFTTTTTPEIPVLVRQSRGEPVVAGGD